MRVNDKQQLLQFKPDQAEILINVFLRDVNILAWRFFLICLLDIDVHKVVLLGLAGKGRVLNLQLLDDLLDDTASVQDRCLHLSLLLNLLILAIDFSIFFQNLVFL